MKKLILFLLFSIGLQAQVNNPGFFTVQVIKCKVEIDGHISDKRFFFKATLENIEIYDENKNYYQLRKCSKEKCDIIHLDPKNSISINNYPGYRISPTLNDLIVH